MIPTYFGKGKAIFIETIHKLKGSDKRKALAKMSKSLGKGGQSTVAKEFNVSRNTIRKGEEVKLPNLLEDITDIIDTQSQTDPDFGTTRLFLG